LGQATRDSASYEQRSISQFPIMSHARDQYKNAGRIKPKNERRRRLKKCQVPSHYIDITIHPPVFSSEKFNRMSRMGGFARLGL
jgi:hypothetical protein